ncbi:hypothetical protein JOC77_000718 [Peribacillus deserti]|uniref:Uncharacterized protein n=1 Tax=Peribacillus deserti TaxID=673318 RepID=A0ABS2QFL4_9BACI|nr:hypothetical protein [Peribacillus deserti]MBM7691313.1 hypothetical protein [Peribacillus deserti]
MERKVGEDRPDDYKRYEKISLDYEVGEMETAPTKNQPNPEEATEN